MCRKLNVFENKIAFIGSELFDHSLEIHTHLSFDPPAVNNILRFFGLHRVWLLQGFKLKNEFTQMLRNLLIETIFPAHASVALDNSYFFKLFPERHYFQVLLRVSRSLRR